MTVCFNYIHHSCAEPCPAGRDHVDICALRHDPAAAGCALYHLGPAECADYQRWLDAGHGSADGGTAAAPANFCRDFAYGKCDRGDSCRYAHIARAPRGKRSDTDRRSDRNTGRSDRSQPEAGYAPPPAHADTPAGHIAVARRHIQKRAAASQPGAIAGDMQPETARPNAGRHPRSAEKQFESILDDVTAAVEAGQPLGDLAAAGADARLLLRGEPAADFTAAAELVSLGLRVPAATAAMVTALRAFLTEVASRATVHARAEKIAATAAAFARLLATSN